MCVSQVILVKLICAHRVLAVEAVTRLHKHTEGFSVFTGLCWALMSLIYNFKRSHDSKFNSGGDEEERRKIALTSHDCHMVRRVGSGW